MAVMVAVPDSAEGAYALGVAREEAQARGTTLVVVDLTLGVLDAETVAAGTPGLTCEIVGRRGRGDRDQAEAVLHALAARPDVDRLVIGVSRRSPVGKLVLGSVSQRLILEADVPVLAVKLPRG